MSHKPQEGPGLPVPPPVLYLAALFIAVGLHYLWPIALAPGKWGSIAGVLLILLGAAILPPALAQFRRFRTPFDPRKPASALITVGPYRYSRNPGYVALTLWYLGIGLILSNGWVLLLVLPLLVIMDRWVIRKEEQHLEAKFGAEYQRYKSAVRRWL